MKRVPLLLMTVIIAIMSTNQTMAQFVAKPLPYAYNALGDAISEQTLKLHHDKHYEGYVANLNKLTGGTPFAAMDLVEVIENADGAIFNNAAQAWNHEFYFDQFSATPKKMPEGALLAAINSSFASVDAFKEAVSDSAMKLFGSGWVWVVPADGGKLSIINTANGDTPIAEGTQPLLTVDVWEHAYYLDHQNRRADAVTKFWDVVDWAVIESRLE